MFKRILAIATVMVAATSLTACGGGGEQPSLDASLPVAVVVDTSAPTPVVEAPVIDEVPTDEVDTSKADVVLRQVKLVKTVTPGETTVITRFKVECKTSWSTYCQTYVPFGEFLVHFDIEVDRLKLVYNGDAVGASYGREIDPSGKVFWRVNPHYFTAYQAGTLDVVATISPYAKTGEKSSVMVEAVDASVDKVMLLVEAKNKVEVLPLPHLAPVEFGGATPSSVKVVGFGQVGKFTVRCPDSVSAGCRLEKFNFGIYGVTPFSVVSIYIGGIHYAGYGVSEDAYLDAEVYPSRWMWPGEVVEVQIFGEAEDGFVQVYGTKAVSGGEVIAPKIDNANCESLLTEGTNGGTCGVGKG